MPEFKTIADYYKPKSPIQSFKEQASLIELANKIQAAPVEKKLRDIDLALKGNELLMTGINNEISRVDLLTKQNEERRKQVDFTTKQLEGLPAIFNQNFVLGSEVLSKIMPGALASENKDGTVSVAMPNQEGEYKSFTLDPRRVADPEKIAAMEKGFRDEWSKASGSFSIQGEFFQNLQRLNKLGTAQADIGIVFSYMKLLDPTSVVREGEAATARNAPGVSEQLRNMYNRLLTSDAPIFGPVGGNTRINFENAAKQLFDTAKANLSQKGRFYINVARDSNLKPQNIIIPAVDVTYESLLEEMGEGPVKPQRQRGPDAGIEVLKSTGFFDTKTPETRSKSYTDVLKNLFTSTPSGRK